MLHSHFGMLAPPELYSTKMTFCDEAQSSQFFTLSILSTNTGGSSIRGPQMGSAVVCGQGKGQSLIYKKKKFKK